MRQTVALNRRGMRPGAGYLDFRAEGSALDPFGDKNVEFSILGVEIRALSVWIGRHQAAGSQQAAQMLQILEIQRV